MLAGVLELQLLANMASLATDMKRAERVVQDSTDKMGRAVGNLESAFGKLGGTLSLVVAFDQVRRLTDDYTKLTAQLRIATHSQAEYAQGLSEVRRISTLAQADINATAMLYTRLSNSLGGYGATQKQVSTITEVVSLGLKAYGATATEAASSMLQLSQAFASNRLGGDEFRAVMETMPNLMRVLATSMHVPYESLKALSAEGKITNEDLMKAFDNPALIAALLKQADMTRTITGEMAVFRNNLKMLVGELMDSSDGTRNITGALKSMSEAVKFLEQNLSSVISLLTAYVGYLALMGTQAVLSWGQARLVTVAHTQALVANAIGKKAHADAIAFAKRIETEATREAFIATLAETRARLAGTLTTEERTAAELRLATAIAAVNADETAAIAIERSLGIARAASTAAEVERTAVLAASSAGAIRWGTSISAAIAMIGTSVSAAVLANPIGLAVAAIGAITLAIVNWDAVVKGSKATFNWFGETIDALVFGAKALSINLGEAFALITVGFLRDTKQITPEQFKAMWTQIKADAEQSKIELINLGHEKIDHEKVAAAERYVNDRKEWEKLTNTHAQQRAAEIAALKDHYRALVKGQVLTQQTLTDNEERYAQGLAIINAKYDKKDVSSATEGWKKRLAEQAAAIAGVAEEGRKLTKSETEYNDLMLVLNTTKDKQLKNAGEELMFDAQQNVAKEAANILTAEQIKLAEKQTEEMRKINAHGITQIDTLDKEIAAQKLHNDSIGKSAEEIAKLKTKAEELLIIKLQIEAADLAGKATDDAGAATRLANIKAEIAKREELRGLKAAGPALEAAKKIADEERKVNEKLWNDIDGFAHTAFDNIFDKGKNVFEELGKVIKKSILDMLYQMTIKKWFIPISVTGGAGASGLAGAADATGGNAGGSGNWLQAGSSVYSALTGSFTALADTIEVAAAHIGGGLASAGATQTGNMLVNNAGNIGTWGAGAAGFAGGVMLGSMIGGDKKIIGLDSTSTAAIGAAIGLAVGGPLGALVGGIAGGVFSAAFGSGATPALQYGAQNLQGKFTPSGFSGQLAQTVNQPGTKGGWFGGGDYGWSRTDYTALTAKQQGGLNSAFASTALVMGSLIAASGEADKSLTGWSFAINRTVKSQEEQTQLANDLALSLGNFLIPALKDFQLEGESLATTATRMRDEFVLTSNIANLMGKDITTAFGSVGFASAAMRDNLVRLMGGLQTANTSMQSYYQNFFSDAERHTLDLNALTLQFAQLGKTIPSTRDGYRKMIEAQDLSTAAGQQMFASLLSLAPAFDSVTKFTDALNTSLSSLSTDYFTSKVEYDRLMGRVQGGSTKTPTTNAELLEELKAMRLELASLRDASNATARNTKQTADTLRNVSQDGTAFNTVPA